ncbi:MAG: AraC family transcriptional regulator [Lachnospiraceae bacterium]|nr:AraC family transcriptional regulator [Lachnospiraceae bacterium]
MKTYKTYTDETLRETVQHGSDRYPFAYYPEDIWQFDFHRVEWHWHHELEFIFVAEGDALCLVGTDKIELSKGCGLFINSGILHRFEAKSSVFVPNIVFSPTLLAPERSPAYEKYIAPIISASVPYQILKPQITWQDCILQILLQIFALQEADEKNELRTICLLLQAWDILSSHLEVSSDLSNPHRLNYKQARLQTMMQYIHDHYMEEITLEMIASSASISKSSALHIFQTGIHLAPVAYLIEYRLAQAAEQLYTTQKSITSIAEETGFTSAGYFCRKFREHYHMSPNTYRRKKTERNL